MQELQRGHALSLSDSTHDHNEDSLVIGQWTLCAAETETPRTLPFHCQPVGGRGCGRSRRTSHKMPAHLWFGSWREALMLDSEQRLRDVLNACNRALYGYRCKSADADGNGHDGYGVAHVRSSIRVQRRRQSGPLRAGGTSTSLCADDSPPLAPGQKTPLSSPRLLVEASRTPTSSHMSRHLRSRPEGRACSASDGLSDLVNDETLSDLLEESEDSSQVAFELWKAAIEASMATTTSPWPRPSRRLTHLHWPRFSLHTARALQCPPTASRFSSSNVENPHRRGGHERA